MKEYKGRREYSVTMGRNSFPHRSSGYRHSRRSRSRSRSTSRDRSKKYESRNRRSSSRSRRRSRHRSRERSPSGSRKRSRSQSRSKRSTRRSRSHSSSSSRSDSRSRSRSSSDDRNSQASKKRVFTEQQDRSSKEGLEHARYNAELKENASKLEMPSAQVVSWDGKVDSSSNLSKHSSASVNPLLIAPPPPSRWEKDHSPDVREQQVHQSYTSSKQSPLTFESSRSQPSSKHASQDKLEGRPSPVDLDKKSLVITFSNDHFKSGPAKSKPSVEGRLGPHPTGEPKGGHEEYRREEHRSDADSQNIEKRPSVPEHKGNMPLMAEYNYPGNEEETEQMQDTGSLEASGDSSKSSKAKSTSKEELQRQIKELEKALKAKRQAKKKTKDKSKGNADEEKGKVKKKQKGKEQAKNIDKKQPAEDDLYADLPDADEESVKASMSLVEDIMMSVRAMRSGESNQNISQDVTQLFNPVGLMTNKAAMQETQASPNQATIAAESFQRNLMNAVQQGTRDSNPTLQLLQSLGITSSNLLSAMAGSASTMDGSASSMAVSASSMAGSASSMAGSAPSVMPSTAISPVTATLPSTMTYTIPATMTAVSTSNASEIMQEPSQDPYVTHTDNMSQPTGGGFPFFSFQEGQALPGLDLNTPQPTASGVSFRNADEEDEFLYGNDSLENKNPANPAPMDQPNIQEEYVPETKPPPQKSEESEEKQLNRILSAIGFDFDMAKRIVSQTKKKDEVQTVPKKARKQSKNDSDPLIQQVPGAPLQDEIQIKQHELKNPSEETVGKPIPSLLTRTETRFKPSRFRQMEPEISPPMEENSVPQPIQRPEHMNYNTFSQPPPPPVRPETSWSNQYYTPSNTQPSAYSEPLPSFTPAPPVTYPTPVPLVATPAPQAPTPAQPAPAPTPSQLAPNYNQHYQGYTPQDYGTSQAQPQPPTTYPPNENTYWGGQEPPKSVSDAPPEISTNFNEHESIQKAELPESPGRKRKRTRGRSPAKSLGDSTDRSFSSSDGRSFSDSRSRSRSFSRSTSRSFSRTPPRRRSHSKSRSRSISPPRSTELKKPKKKLIKEKKAKKNSKKKVKRKADETSEVSKKPSKKGKSSSMDTASIKISLSTGKDNDDGERRIVMMPTTGDSKDTKKTSSQRKDRSHSRELSSSGKWSGRDQKAEEKERLRREEMESSFRQAEEELILKMEKKRNEMAEEIERERQRRLQDIRSLDKDFSRKQDDLKRKEGFLRRIEDKVKRDNATRREKEDKFERDCQRKLKKDKEEYKRRYHFLERELNRLKKQQAELLKKKQRDQDVRGNPEIDENIEQQQEVKDQMKSLRFAYSDVYGKPIQDASPPRELEKKKSGASEKENLEKEGDENDTKSHGNYIYYDTGENWCKSCNKMLKNINELFIHLHSKYHMKTSDPHDRPWKSLNPAPSSTWKQQQGAIQAPIKGCELIVPANAFYCRLCKVFSGDVGCATDHVKSSSHNIKYQKFIEENPLYEKQLEADKKESKTPITKSLSPEPEEQKKNDSQEVKPEVNEVPVKLDDDSKERARKRLEQAQKIGKRPGFTKTISEKEKLKAAMADFKAKEEAKQKDAEKAEQAILDKFRKYNEELFNLEATQTGLVGDKGQEEQKGKEGANVAKDASSTEEDKKDNKFKFKLLSGKRFGSTPSLKTTAPTSTTTSTTATVSEPVNASTSVTSSPTATVASASVTNARSFPVIGKRPKSKFQVKKTVEQPKEKNVHKPVKSSLDLFLQLGEKGEKTVPVIIEPEKPKEKPKEKAKSEKVLDKIDTKKMPQSSATTADVKTESPAVEDMKTEAIAKTDAETKPGKGVFDIIANTLLKNTEKKKPGVFEVLAKYGESTDATKVTTSVPKVLEPLLPLPPYTPGMSTPSAAFPPHQYHSNPAPYRPPNYGQMGFNPYQGPPRPPGMIPPPNTSVPPPRLPPAVMTSPPGNFGRSGGRLPTPTAPPANTLAGSGGNMKSGGDGPTEDAKKFLAEYGEVLPEEGSESRKSSDDENVEEDFHAYWY